MIRIKSDVSLDSLFVYNFLRDDSDGNYYIYTFDNKKITKIDSNTRLLTLMFNGCDPFYYRYVSELLLMMYKADILEVIE